ncbi:MAG: CoA transferase, partial [Acidimicrobiia bacterium]|nr:CoA transferase [Acidimicrobiia bacterium]
KTREEWDEIFRGSDACVSPVLSWSEAPRHPHNLHRGTFIEHGESVVPGSAPRFSRTLSVVAPAAVESGAHTDEILVGIGLSESDIAALRTAGTIA